MGLTSSRVNPKPKHYISVFPNNDFSILHLSNFYFSLLSVNSYGPLSDGKLEYRAKGGIK